ncbi:hypothetical protein XELAEV_18041717mg [Xenopus laevis]|uniref:Uncharacterized protein n=1 Tax=Xenopus laevis TaxID=8355 RepID=A0A974C3W5_XENLA|nr:hypothetical protein XELAEV_18041717mg [Xenopus laevis]
MRVHSHHTGTLRLRVLPETIAALKHLMCQRPGPLDRPRFDQGVCVVARHPRSLLLLTSYPRLKLHLHAKCTSPLSMAGCRHAPIPI